MFLRPGEHILDNDEIEAILVCANRSVHHGDECAGSRRRLRPGRHEARRHGELGVSANLVGVAALSYKRQRPLQRGDEVIVPAFVARPIIRSSSTDYACGSWTRPADAQSRCFPARGRADEPDAMVVAVSILGNRRLSTSSVVCDTHGLYFFEVTASRWEPRSAAVRAARLATSIPSAPSTRSSLDDGGGCCDGRH